MKDDIDSNNSSTNSVPLFLMASLLAIQQREGGVDQPHGVHTLTVGHH